MEQAPNVGLGRGNRKVAVIGVVVGVVVIVLAWWLILGFGGGTPAGPGAGGVQPKGEDVFRPENENALQTVQGGTREVVQTDIATPNAGATDAPQNVAVPTTVVPTGPSSFRHFDITGAGGEYAPNTIVVNDGDVIDIKLSAVDHAYNMTFPDFGISQTAAKGGTAKIQFQGTPFGEYRFYCKDVCSGTVEGKLIVNKK